MAHRFPRPPRAVLAACLLLGVAGCRSAPDPPRETDRARRVQVVRGFGFPESVSRGGSGAERHPATPRRRQAARTALGGRGN
ncbi:MAG TPA: hypothetical protein VHG28_05235, partial [Longimicrobiaceae bacterium]|nr:hypothetical protein [Longimicrobiaceae bacterium]